MWNFFYISGKKFVFDIRRTCRETYEYARRTLYRAEQQAQANAHLSGIPSLASASVPAALDVLSSGELLTYHLGV